MGERLTASQEGHWVR